MRRALVIASLLAITLAGLGALAETGYRLYVQRVVSQSPSTRPVLATEGGPVQLGGYRGGDQVLPAVTATPAVTVGASPTPTVLIAPGAADSRRAEGPPRPALPPTRLRIPRIGVDAPIVLADNDDLPRFKGVGWYVGTGYPGFRGNLVLFGHLNGPYETFGRLHELRANDQVSIEAMDRTYQYRVVEKRVVPASAVEVLAPTADSRATLITCTGTFYPLTRDYSDRLIVTALLQE